VIILKRFLLLALTVAMLSILSACRDNTDYSFNINGRYTVTEENTGIAFMAEISDHGKQIVFTAPSALIGVKAYSTDGNIFTVESKDVSETLGSFSIKTANDFFAAMELLHNIGIRQGSTLSASIDSITAKALFENNCVTELAFNDGMHARKYKIITEATE